MVFREVPGSNGQSDDGSMASFVEVQVLKELEDAGELTAEKLEELSRDPSHPFHHRLVWNNEEAGFRYRVEQCRVIIRSYRVIVSVKKREVIVPVYVHDVTRRSGYIGLSTLRDKPDPEQRAMLRYEFSKALTWVKRACNLADSLEAGIRTDSIIRGLERIVDNLESEEAVPA